MTITIVLPFVNLTGGIRVMLDYANALHDAGHTVTVAYPAWPYRFGLKRSQQWMEFRREIRRTPRVGWFALRARLLRVPAVHAVFLPRADVVIATSWPTAHDVARLPRSRGRKVQIVFHHESGTGPESRIRAIYQLPFRRIAFSRFVRDSVGGEFDCAIHDLVPNGVDPLKFFPDAPREHDLALFLFHPDPRKGAADAIDALRLARERRPDLKVRAIGTVRPEAALPSWIEFTFHPDDATLRRAYSTASVLLYPSRYEGFGLPPLEAMACGCPVVTTRVGAVPDYGRDGVNLLMTEPGDVQGLSDRIVRVVDDRALAARLSEQGLRTAAEWSTDTAGAAFEDALRRALDA